MEDRQPRYPGRVIFTRSDNGESIQGVLEMADDPIVEGTPPTKPNLFDDETQSRYLPGTETVNLALRQTVLLSDKATDAEAAAGTDDSKWMTPKKVKGAIDDVGDIRITERPSLGEKYLLANGVKVDPNAYPKLLPYLIRKYPYSSFSNKTIVSQNNIGTDIYGNAKFVYLNGYYIYIAHPGYGPLIAYYATNPLGSWSSKTLITSPYGTFINIAYGNGKWVIITANGYSINYYTATSLTGTWFDGGSVPLNFGNSSQADRMNIKFLNEYFVVYGQVDNGYVAYTRDLSSWSQFRVWSSGTVTDMLYADGYYLCAGNTGIYRSASLGSMFSKVTLQDDTHDVIKLADIDNKILFVLSNGSAGYMDGSTGTIHYISNLPTAPIKFSNFDWAILKKEGYWLYVVRTSSGHTLYYTSNLNSSWSSKTIVSSTNLNSNHWDHFSVFEYGDYFMLMYLNANLYPVITYSESGYFLPTVSVTGAKAFIKAKE